MRLPKPKKSEAIGYAVWPAKRHIQRSATVVTKGRGARAKKLLRIFPIKARRDFRSNEGALDEFLQLTGALEKDETEQILAFVRKWGTLKLCKHGLPYTHRKKPGDAPCRALRDEPLAVWRRYVKEAREAVDAAVGLQKHRVSPGPPYPDWWERIRHNWEDRKDILRERAEEQAEKARRIVFDWLEASGLMLLPHYTYGSGFSLSFEHDERLFDILTAQLLMAVAGAAGLGLCAACGRPFRLKRRPKPGQRSFCSRRACQKKSVALRVRDYVSRARSAQSRQANRNRKNRNGKEAQS